MEQVASRPTIQVPRIQLANPLPRVPSLAAAHLVLLGHYMNFDALPPLLRGVGMTIILIGTLIAFASARQDMEQHRLPEKVAEVERKPATNLKALLAEVHALREEIEQNNIAEEVLENRWFEWLGFLGSGVLASSFYVEWYIRKGKTV